MEYAIIAAMIIAAGGWVFYPLLRSRYADGFSFDRPDDREEALQQRKENVYAAIKEIDFDYQMGKLSKDDYEHLTTQYKGQAVHILQSLDALRQTEDTGLDASIEQEVRQLREQHRADMEAIQDDTIPSFVSFCPQCGVKALPHSNFCHGCGHNLAMPGTEDPA